MAKKKKVAAPNGAQVVHLHVGDRESERETDDEEVEALDAIEEGQLSRAIEEIRNVEGAKAEVYRVLPADRAGHCRVYAVAVFSHERVAADYGPGKYRVRFKGPGDKYIRGGGTFDIAEGLTPAGGNQASAIQDLLALMKAERETERIEREKRKGEWFEWAKLLAPLVAPKILDMIGGGSKAPSLRDMAATLKDLKELQAPTQDLNSQFGQVVQILEGAKTLIGDGDSKTGSTWVDLLRDFLQSPAMGALAASIPGMGMPRTSPGSFSPVAGVPRITATVPPPAAPSSVCVSALAGSSASCRPQDPQGADVLAQLQWLKGTLEQLLVQAAKQGNAKLYAEVVLDNLPPFIKPDDLMQRLAADDWITQLASVDERVKLYVEWFQKFRDYAIRVLRRRARKSAELVAAGGAVGTHTPSPAADGFNQPRSDVEEGGLDA